MDTVEDVDWWSDTFVIMAQAQSFNSEDLLVGQVLVSNSSEVEGLGITGSLYSFGNAKAQIRVFLSVAKNRSLPTDLALHT